MFTIRTIRTLEARWLQQRELIQSWIPTGDLTRRTVAATWQRIALSWPVANYQVVRPGKLPLGRLRIVKPWPFLGQGAAGGHLPPDQPEGRREAIIRIELESELEH